MGDGTAHGVSLGFVVFWVLQVVWARIGRRVGRLVGVWPAGLVCLDSLGLTGLVKGKQIRVW